MLLSQATRWAVGLAVSAMLAGLPAVADTLPYKNPKLPIEDRVGDLLGRLTLQEKVGLLSGGTDFTTRPIERLGVPALHFSDGPNGVRSNDGEPATVFPVGVAMAATWNPALIAEVGKAIGQEARALGDHVLLGPNVNIQRSPLGGRSFESYSEDPVLAGRIGVGFVTGVQSQGIGTSVKHFAANNQEYERMRGSSNVDERTLREIYFPAFERIVKEAKPWTVMAAYNKVNGTYASENRWLLKDVLKQGWGFDGMVVSDWGAVHSIVPAAEAGLDIEMPGPGTYMPQLVAAAENWQIPQTDIDDNARRVLRLIVRSGLLDDKPLPKGEINSPQHRQTAQSAAEEAITLLRNEGNLLPLDPKAVKSIAIIGPNGDKAVLQGGGSAHVVPSRETTPLEAMKALLGDGIRLAYSQGVENEPVAPVADARLLSPTETRDAKGLTAQYFSNRDLSGTPVKSVVESYFFKLGFGGALVADAHEQFSARWQGFFWPPRDGVYEFSTMSFAKVTLLLDGKVVISDATPTKPSGILDFFHLGQRTAEVTLKAGRPYPIRLDYAPSTIPAHLLRFGIRSPNGTIEDAAAAAKAADAAIVFVGSTSATESEGLDRSDMNMYGRQDELVEAVLAANKRTIVVLNSGAPVTMPWIARAPAVVEAWFPGQEGAVAIANVLFGKVNPSGKLPVTFPKRLEDNPAYLYYPGGQDEDYGEGIFVGYRYYEKRKQEPLFPFGHGLSYTKFDYGGLRAPDQVPSGQAIDVGLTVKNVGDRAGKETVQLYVAPQNPSVSRPVKELKAFEKVPLGPGESKAVTLSVTPRDLSYYDVHKQAWVLEPGTYDLMVGSSSADIRLKASVRVVAGGR